jgi:hypothetical protein
MVQGFYVMAFEWASASSGMAKINFHTSIALKFLASRYWMAKPLKIVCFRAANVS